MFAGQLHLDAGDLNPIERLMSFLCHMLEARWWSYSTIMWSLPEGFASFLSPTSGQSRFWAAFFTAAFAIEANAAAGPSGHAAFTVLKEVFWWNWPLVQWLARLLEHCRCRLVDEQGAVTSEMAGRLIRLLHDLISRLGDTKCVEETHGMGRSIEQRGQKPDLLSCREFYSRMQGPKTPLASRGVPHVTTDERTPFEGAVSKMPHPWDLVFAKRAKAHLPATVLDHLPNFSGKTPAGTRPSIGAAVALTELHQADRLHEAKTLWHAIALLPHSLICDSDHVFMVLAQGRFAARVWKADKLAPQPDSPASGVEKGSWGFRLIAWEWLVVTDIRKWSFLPSRWDTNTVLCDQYGCLRAVQVGEAVPALAEALVVKGRRRLCRGDRIGFHHAFDIKTPMSAKPAQVRSGDQELMAHLLEGREHDQVQKYMNRLEEFHKWEEARNKRRQTKSSPTSGALSHDEDSSGGSTDQGSGKQCALTVAALGEMDEANRREWQQSKKASKMMGTKGFLQAARGILRGERQQRAKEGGKARSAVRCNISWARPYVPGTKESGVALPEGVTRSCLEASRQERKVWVARYKHPNLQKAGLRPTRSKSYRERTTTEHMAFQTTLTWLWNRHASCSAQGAELPMHVQQI